MWMEHELERLFEGIKLYGKDWNKVTDHVGTRDKIAVFSQATAQGIKFEENDTLPDLEIASESESSEEEVEEKKSRVWTEEENARLIEGVRLHRNSWARVAEVVETRSIAAIKSRVALMKKDPNDRSGGVGMSALLKEPEPQKRPQRNIDRRNQDYYMIGLEKVYIK